MNTNEYSLLMGLTGFDELRGWQGGIKERGEEAAGSTHNGECATCVALFGTKKKSENLKKKGE
jgi:hypothetical protein